MAILGVLGGSRTWFWPKMTLFGGFWEPVGGRINGKTPKTTAKTPPGDPPKRGRVSHSPQGKMGGPKTAENALEGSGFFPFFRVSNSPKHAQFFSNAFIWVFWTK